LFYQTDKALSNSRKILTLVNYTLRRQILGMVWARARGIMPQSRKNHAHDLTTCGIYC